MDSCSKCDKGVEFESPALLCRHHWIEWWCRGTQESTKEVVEFIKLLDKLGMSEIEARWHKKDKRKARNRLKKRRGW